MLTPICLGFEGSKILGGNRQLTRCQINFDCHSCPKLLVNESILFGHQGDFATASSSKSFNGSAFGTRSLKHVLFGRYMGEKILKRCYNVIYCWIFFSFSSVMLWRKFYLNKKGVGGSRFFINPLANQLGWGFLKSLILKYLNSITRKVRKKSLADTSIT